MLKGKSAVVTGSTKRHRMGIAAALAAQGANVMLNGFGDANEIKTFRVGFEREHGVKAAQSGADMQSPAQIHAMIAEVERIFGAVDILVNNAGIQHLAPVDEFPQDKWDAIIARWRRSRYSCAPMRQPRSPALRSRSTAGGWRSEAALVMGGPCSVVC